jgi:hypothetical protein
VLPPERLLPELPELPLRERLELLLAAAEAPVPLLLPEDLRLLEPELRPRVARALDAPEDPEDPLDDRLRDEARFDDPR